MHRIIEITSLQNPKLKNALSLLDRRDRNASGLFLIEGYRELKRAVDQKTKVQALFFCEELFLGENEPELIAEVGTQGAELYACSTAVFHKLSYRDRPDGLIAIGVQMHKQLSDIPLENLPHSPFFLVAEAIEKPGNLGTILRSCDAVGVDGVIVCDRCTDIYNPNVVRASVGTLFTVPVIETTSQETIGWLKKNGIRTVATSPHATSAFTEEDLSGPIAIVVGTEQLGLSQQWMESADLQVRIPMKGVADSLNVATATTLLLYEVLRQRENKRKDACR